MIRVILRGRRSIWCGWRVMPVAPRNVNDVSYVTRSNHDRHFSWQAIFGEVGGSHLLLRGLYWTFHVRQGSTIRIIFRGTTFGEVCG